MFNFLVFGFMTGLLASALTRRFTFRDVSGFIILSIAGAFEGQFLANLLGGHYIPKSQLISALFIMTGAILMTFVEKIILEHRHTLAGDGTDSLRIQLKTSEQPKEKPKPLFELPLANA